MGIWIAAGVIGFLGLVITFAGLGGVRRGHRRAAGMVGAIAGVVMLGVGGVLALAGLNLRTYERLTSEQFVAQLTFAQLAPQSFRAVLRTSDGVENAYDLMGDDWRLEARVIKFPAWANVAGYDSLYRLDRLDGRYSDVNQEINDRRTVYALSANPGLDVWELARARGMRSLKIDSYFGSGVFSPMADGAQFEVSLTQSALVVRPINPQAQAAMGAWDGRSTLQVTPQAAPIAN